MSAKKWKRIGPPDFPEALLVLGHHAALAVVETGPDKWIPACDDYEPLWLRLLDNDGGYSAILPMAGTDQNYVVFASSLLSDELFKVPALPGDTLQFEEVLRAANLSELCVVDGSLIATVVVAQDHFVLQLMDSGDVDFLVSETGFAWPAAVNAASELVLHKNAEGESEAFEVRVKFFRPTLGG